MNTQTVKPELKSPEMKGNILLSEFRGLKFEARKENSSYGQKFDTYAECLEWIEERGFEGYIPELGWGCGVGDHHENWNSLMQVVEKIESLFMAVQIREQNCYMDWTGAEPDDNNLLAVLTKFQGIDEDASTKIEATYNACVKCVAWLIEAGYCQLRKGGGDE